jgi:hypothetical protein
MAITCFIRYEIDPFQRDAFREYAANWGRIIRRCGGDLVGWLSCRTKDELRGLGADRVRRPCRLRELSDPAQDRSRGRANFAFAQERRLIQREERTFVETVDGTFASR